MPLPDAVLFPGVLLPLYIFESHYRQLLADCLEGERVFAVGLLRKGWERAGIAPEPHRIAGVGLIRTCVGQPDGTSHVLLQGLARVRIRRYAAAGQDRSYPVADIEPLTSLSADPAAERGSLVGMVKKLAKARARLGVEVPKAVLDSLLALDSPELFTDVVSHTLLDSSDEKQSLLETLDVNQRFAKLVTLLQKQIGQFELWKTLQGRLPNKDVGSN